IITVLYFSNMDLLRTLSAISSAPAAGKEVGHASLGLLRAEQSAGPLRFGGKAVALRIPCQAQAHLASSERERMQAGHFLCELARLGFQLGARHSPLHHTELPRALAVYPVASEDDARGHGGPCDPRQPLRSTTAREKAEPDLGQSEPGLVGSNAQIAAERQLVATAHGCAADLGQAHLRQIGDALEQFLEWPRGLGCCFHLVRGGEARGDL